MRCPCQTCPDGVNRFGCCSDCVYDDDLNCQHISACPTCQDFIEDLTCAKSEWCIEDDHTGPQCISCAAITCPVGQDCVYGVGCTQSTIIENSEIIEGSNVFGYDLVNELYNDSSTNMWISPFCISSCLV